MNVTDFKKFLEKGIIRQDVLVIWKLQNGKKKLKIELEIEKECICSKKGKTQRRQIEAFQKWSVALFV